MRRDQFGSTPRAIKRAHGADRGSSPFLQRSRMAPLGVQEGAALGFGLSVFSYLGFWGFVVLYTVPVTGVFKRILCFGSCKYPRI